MIFDTFQDAEDYYYKHHECDSDDVDREHSKIERWLESEGHLIREDNPDVK